MLDTARFTDLEVLGDSFVGGNSFVGGELIVGELDIITDMSVSGMASVTVLEVSTHFAAPSFISSYSDTGSFMYVFGDVEFGGEVTGLPEANGPKHHAARVSKSGRIEFNSGFMSIGLATEGVYEYVFQEAIPGAEYSVVATSNFNEGNIHCNITEINSFGFVVETGRNASKPAPCAHSVQVVYG